jgi:hypothetical protein
MIDLIISSQIKEDRGWPNMEEKIGIDLGLETYIDLRDKISCV